MSFYLIYCKRIPRKGQSKRHKFINWQHAFYPPLISAYRGSTERGEQMKPGTEHGNRGQPRGGLRPYLMRSGTGAAALWVRQSTTCPAAERLFSAPPYLMSPHPVLSQIRGRGKSAPPSVLYSLCCRICRPAPCRAPVSPPALPCGKISLKPLCQAPKAS